MSTTELIERIKALTPLQRQEIAAHIERLSRPAGSGAFPKELLDRITARRESIHAEKGTLPDSTDFIRRTRDTGDE